MEGMRLKVNRETEEEVKQAPAASGAMRKAEHRHVNSASESEKIGMVKRAESVSKTSTPRTDQTDHDLENLSV